MVGYQINVHEQYQNAKDYSDPVEDDEVFSWYETYVFINSQTLLIVNRNVKRVDTWAQLTQHDKEQGDDHSHETCIVKQSNVIIDPKTVVVEFCGAPVTLLAMLRVVHHVAIAYTTEKLELIFIKEDDFLSLAHLLVF